jgi:hypothetical protein
MDHGQAETGALAHFLGREEGLDRAPQGVVVHSCASVGDDEPHIATLVQVLLRRQ